MFPLQARLWPRGWVEVELYSFMTTALEGSEGSAARPGRTLPSGKTRYTLYRRLAGPQGRSGRAENLAPPGFDPRTVQPVVSRYTDWATRPTLKTILFIYPYIRQPFLFVIMENIVGINKSVLFYAFYLFNILAILLNKQKWIVKTQACYELNKSCFRISGSVVYYSDGAVSWTAGNHVSIPDMGKRYFFSPKISGISWGPPSLIFSQPTPDDFCCG